MTLKNYTYGEKDNLTHDKVPKFKKKINLYGTYYSFDYAHKSQYICNSVFFGT